MRTNKRCSRGEPQQVECIVVVVAVHLAVDNTPCLQHADQQKSKRPNPRTRAFEGSNTAANSGKDPADVEHHCPEDGRLVLLTRALPIILNLRCDRIR